MASERKPARPGKDEQIANQMSNINLGGEQKNYNQSGERNVMYNDGVHYHGSSVAGLDDQTMYDACIEKLQFPDPYKVKTRLLESKDKLLLKAIDWIFHEESYNRWLNGDDTCLLWIKGGAGKGKTMMSIGLAEHLSRLPGVTSFFFCQNTNYELNTAESIIKGLIRRLADQRKHLRSSLREIWSKQSSARQSDVSLDELWDTLLSMLDQCKSEAVYVLIDALDECEEGGVASLLQKIVRSGLNHPSKIKWLLTSRPLEPAERILLASEEQVRVSLELNPSHIAKAVEEYVTYKVEELARKHRYESRLKNSLKQQLIEKSGGTFLWIHLVCRRIGDVDAVDAVSVIDTAPPGLDAFYARIIEDLSNSADAQACLRLLQSMLLVFRPLNIDEVESVTGISPEIIEKHDILDRCASMINVRDGNIEFVHQSVRDFLYEQEDGSPLFFFGSYDRNELLIQALEYLNANLKVNLLDLPHPDSTWDDPMAKTYPEKQSILNKISYVATFWGQHLFFSDWNAIVAGHTVVIPKLMNFLQTRFLEWLECLALLHLLQVVFRALDYTSDLSDDVPDPEGAELSTLVHDAIRFSRFCILMIEQQPLQVYSSALAFAPRESLIKRHNIQKVPSWLTSAPRMQGKWSAIRQVIPYPAMSTNHKNNINIRSIVFSPDGQTIMSTDRNGARYFHRIETGQLQLSLTIECSSLPDWSLDVDRLVRKPTLADRFRSRKSMVEKAIRASPYAELFKRSLLAREFARDTASVAPFSAYSSDGKVLGLSCKHGHCLHLYDAMSHKLRLILPTNHTAGQHSAVFLHDSKSIATACIDGTVKIWNIFSGEITIVMGPFRECPINSLNLQPGGDNAVVGYFDGVVELRSWSGNRTPLLLSKAHSPRSNGMPHLWYHTAAFEFSQEGNLLAIGGQKAIEIYDVSSREVIKTVDRPNTTSMPSFSRIESMAFSNGAERLLVNHTFDGIEVWNIDEARLLMSTRNVGFPAPLGCISPDGDMIAANSDDVLRIWPVEASTAEIDTGKEAIADVVISRDGSICASLTEQGTFSWNWGTAQKRIEIGRGNKPCIAAFRHELQIAVINTYASHFIVDLQSGAVDTRSLLRSRGQEVATEKGDPTGLRTEAVCLSNDGQFAITICCREPYHSSWRPTHRRTYHVGWYNTTTRSQETSLLLYKSTEIPITAVLSPNDDRIAVLSSDGSVTLINVLCHTSGERKLTFSDLRTLPRLFAEGKKMELKERQMKLNWDYEIEDTEKLYWSTDGRALLTRKHWRSLDSRQVEAEQSKYESMLLTVSDAWVRLGGRKVMMIPREVGLSTWTNGGDEIALGCRTGAVLRLKLDRVALSRIV